MHLFAKYTTMVMLMLTLFFSSVASAQTLPTGHRCTVGGETFQCFDLAEYQELLHMEIDLDFYMQAYPVAMREIEQLTESNHQLRFALDISGDQIDRLRDERTRLLERWTEENRLRLDAEGRPIVGSWIGWGMSAVEAVAILILSIVLGVSGG